MRNGGSIGMPSFSRDPLFRVRYTAKATADSKSVAATKRSSAMIATLLRLGARN